MAEVALILALVMVVAAIATGVWSSSLSTGLRKGLAAFISGSLAGGAFAIGGLGNLVGIHTSSHVFATGVIYGLRQSHGKNSSSSFDLSLPSGSWLQVHCDYAGNRLANGESVSVETLAFHSTLLHLRIDGGPYAGWTLDEGDGTIGSCFAIGLGLILIFAAHTKWQRDPEGKEKYRSRW